MVTPTGEASHRFTALDSLRGIAAVLVAVHHTNAESPIFGMTGFHAGVQFVDLFFVLSGFIIAANYADKLQSGFAPGRFLWLRLGRIYPSHLAMVLCYVMIELFVWLSGQQAITGRGAFTGTRDPAYLAPTLVLAQCLWPAACKTWNVQSWSISVEMLLYLFAAFGWRRLGRAWWGTGLALAVGAGLASRLGLALPWEPILRGLCGFGIGAALWPLWQLSARRLMALPRLQASLLEVLCAMGALAVLLSQWLRDTVLAGDVLFAALVLVLAAERGWISAVLRWRPFVALGVWSYSIYMVHGLAETIVLKAMQRVLGPGLLVQQSDRARPIPSGDWRADLVVLATVLIVIALAALFHHLFEWPTRQWSRRQSSRL